MEDFSRIHLHVGAFYDELKTGKVVAKLKWTSVVNGNPGIRVFRSADPAGSESYLTDLGSSKAQRTGIYATALGLVDTSTGVDLPSDFWDGVSASDPRKCLIYEGVTEGKGERKLEFRWVDGSIIGRAGSTWLELLDIRRMYLRWRIPNNPAPSDPNTISNPFVPNMNVVPDPTGNGGFPYPEYPYEPAWDEDLNDKCFLLCVHGWRKSGFKHRSDEITIFKRLWHCGFKGRYGGLVWPTYDVVVGDGSGAVDEYLSARDSKFDESEYRAWKMGGSVKPSWTPLAEIIGSAWSHIVWGMWWYPLHLSRA